MKLKHYMLSAFAALSVLLAGCQPDEYSFEEADVTSDDLVEGLSYEVTHDSSNPNIVYLTSLMSTSYTVLWEHPQGRSQEAQVTLKMPFAGEYSVVFGVVTSGGVVYADTTYFTIKDFCADFVTDDLWTYISGGVGNSKKWFIDLDENGVSRYFNGPVYFYGTDDSWETVTNGYTIDGDSWNWTADWGSVSGWQWNSYAMDYGYMEFDLNGGSNVTTVFNDPDIAKTTTGTYMLDTDNHIITFTDAQLLHDYTNDSQVSSWTGEMKLLSLTENTMQIGVERTSDPCLLCFNFISEDYFNNWVEAEDEVVAPTLADDWRDYVEPKTNYEITYKMSEDEPFDWFEPDGTRKSLNGNYTALSGVEDITLVLNSNTGVYTLTDLDGNSYEGTYTLSDDGVYTFSDAFPEVTLDESGMIVLKTNSDQTLRILSYEIDDYSGSLSDLWIGSVETDIKGNTVQYLGYHFCPVVAGSVTKYTANLNFFDTGWSFINSENVYISADGYYTFTVSGSSDSPYGMYLDILKLLKDYPNCDVEVTDIKVDGTSIEFDDSIIDRGIGDAETTARRYILNPWGATADDADKYVFTSSIEVTIYVTFENGTPFISESEDE